MVDFAQNAWGCAVWRSADSYSFRKTGQYIVFFVQKNGKNVYAGMIHRCYNTEATGLPMEGNSIKSAFKVYVTDIGNKRTDCSPLTLINFSCQTVHLIDVQ